MRTMVCSSPASLLSLLSLLSVRVAAASVP